jgi:ATPase subunit of ABC transporter with duplicated ATPase domains
VEWLSSAIKFAFEFNQFHENCVERVEVGFTVTAENSTSTLLRVEHVSKRFGATQALHQVSLELHEGEIHGFAGENGA